MMPRIAASAVLLGLTTAALAETVTYSEHVAPILYQKCTPCHRPGEAAPFALMTYEDAVRKARPMARAVETGLMPPWKAAEGAAPFANDRRLTDAESALLRQWVEQGAVEGDTSKLPPAPKFVEGWQLGEPDVVVRMAEPYTVPAEGPDVYRNFVVPVTIPPGKYLKAIEFRPSARSATHHSLFSMDTEGAARQADAADPEPGFTGMDGRFASQGIGGWAVGGMPVPFPDGVAIPLPERFDLVLRSHFHPTGKAETEQSTVGLYLTDEAPTRTMVPVQMPALFGALAGIDVPAGEKDFTIRDRYTVPVDVLVTGLSGHAHMICAEMTATATLPDGSATTLLGIDPWDFSWQEQYRFAEEVTLPAGTVIDVAIRYDNSAENPSNPHSPPQRIAWGRESTDEMGSMTVLMIPKSEAQAKNLQYSRKEHLVASVLNAEGEIPGGRGARVRKMAKWWYDKDGDGRISPSEMDAIMEKYGDRFERLGANGSLTAVQ